ncbi:ATP-binding cassette domain-containing protein [Cupriavidus basilensis]|uniref:ATP-binding cassette domain-containing protein n=1 Tax=Cupriavidus basilensis TaxID=68895 RepID=A0ABT6AJG5_9BURK|nr:ATP-binding cassette domain-containing protein [Cupriavidus basilensis]MDF3832745.1 ATP-binding cassette domain-containing protein [Cupriavidus basilensis]
MLRFEGLSKSFGWRRVIHGAAGTLGPGAYALQGANGSGKSTLLALLAGAIAPDAGEVWIDGLSLARDPVRARQRLAYAPDQSPIYPFMTGYDLLDFVATARACCVDDSVMDMVEEAGLTSHLPTRFSAMSLGTQKKFLLCAAWIGNTPVLLLDEPSNGLDLTARAVVERRIVERSATRLTLFASHDGAFINACGASVVPLGELLSPAG